MKIQLVFRLARVALHVFQGLITCTLLFPWIGAARRNAHIQRWSCQLLRIVGVTVEAEGSVAALEHSMVVANHVSWLDIFVINAVHPCRFVAKSEIRAWPVLGTLAARAGTIFIARGQRRELRALFQGLVDKLRAGQRIAFFPEGTTGTQGSLLPFHANLFEAAVDAEVAVQPYALIYTDSAGTLHPSVEFLGEMTFAASMVQILSGPPVNVRLRCLTPIPGALAHRRELCAAAHAAVAEAVGEAVAEAVAKAAAKAPARHAA